MSFILCQKSCLVISDVLRYCLIGCQVRSRRFEEQSNLLQVNITSSESTTLSRTLHLRSRLWLFVAVAVGKRCASSGAYCLSLFKPESMCTIGGQGLTVFSRKCASDGELRRVEHYTNVFLLGSSVVDADLFRELMEENIRHKWTS